MSTINQSYSAKWTQTKRFAFRVCFLYFTFYFLFISNYLHDVGDVIPGVQYINAPFQFISNSFISIVNSLFLHKPFDGAIYITDTYWSVIAVLSYFIIAIIIALLWTLWANHKDHITLFSYLHTLIRYYLAFVILLYGIDKLFEHQFLLPPWPTSLIQPVPDMDAHTLFWTFMGASKSYNFFIGLVETIVGFLLLFRRTCTIGALLSFAVFFNILMLNIGYDTPIKLFLFHLIIMSVFILTPQLSSLYQFHVLRKESFLVPITPVMRSYKVPRQILKLGMISFFILPTIIGEIKLGRQIANPPQRIIVGIHEIRKFSMTGQKGDLHGVDTLSWKKFAINPLWRCAVQFQNDSVAIYNFNPDTTSRSLQLFSWADSTFKCTLHYSQVGSDEWQFEGSYKNDSIRFVSKKIDLGQHTLLKSIGKVKWLYE